MAKMLEAQLLLCLVTLTAASEQPLVKCTVPVHVKFIVSPEQLQPEFKEEIKQFDCKMNLAAMDVDGIAEVRQLQSSSNSSDDDDDYGDENATNATAPATGTATKTNSSDLSALNQAVDAEMGGAHCWKTWTTGLLSLGLSLSLPVAEAAPGAFRVPSRPQKLKDLTEVVEVLMPCSALFDPLRDLDGDGTFDCKITQEQNAIAESVPEIDGTWHVLSAQSVSGEGLDVEERIPGDSIAIGGGAWCMDPSQNSRWEDKLEHLAKEELPVVLTNVASFAHDGTFCSSEKLCEATMWSFDLAYPASSCTPGVAGWIQPCTAKLLPDGTLVLVRGASVRSGSKTHRPPLMAALTHATDALPFTNGLAAATQSSFEVLLLHKHFENGAYVTTSSHPAARQLQSSGDSSDDNETLSNETSSSTNETSSNESTTTKTSSTTTANATTTANLADLNKTVAAEIGQARGLHVWSTALLGFALRLLVC